MNDTQNTTIVLMLITASILGAMLVSAYLGEEQTARADASVRQGEYIMATGAYSRSIDLLYVIDVPNRVLITYYPDRNKRTLSVVGQRIALDQIFRSGS